MKALRALRTLTSTLSSKPEKAHLNPILFYRFYTAQPQEQDTYHHTLTSEDESSADSVFDGAHYTLPEKLSFDSEAESTIQPTWDVNFREKANRRIFGERTQLGEETGKAFESCGERRGEEKKGSVLAKALLKAALEQPDEDEGVGESLVVTEEDQKSLSVGIIGAPNAGKSALTNYMVGVDQDTSESVAGKWLLQFDDGFLVGGLDYQILILFPCLYEKNQIWKAVLSANAVVINEMSDGELSEIPEASLGVELRHSNFTHCFGMFWVILAFSVILLEGKKQEDICVVDLTLDAVEDFIGRLCLLYKVGIELGFDCMGNTEWNASDGLSLFGYGIHAVGFLLRAV
ncbi:unnamed protein product [Ilex paraguariensis]|uniref:G domain-containing protein n=1 Tax=Ilex paraguariensis TaxID=185542 RepID=A0ABC8TPW3_9AQUA